MASIRGRYEYDDDDLTPGKKKEGGLHQNLFDATGTLRGSARFIPDEDGNDSAPWPTSAYSHAGAEDGCLSAEEREQLERLLQQVVLPLLAVAVRRGAPYAQRFWLEKARPAIRARLDRFARRPRLRRRPAPEEPAVLEGVVVEAVQAEAEVDDEGAKVEMAASQAQARRLLAMALRRASDEELRLLARASIVADDQPAGVERNLPALPSPDAAPVLRRLSAKPASLTDEEALTALHLLLGTSRRR